MPPLDFNSLDSSQARLETVAGAKESPQELKQRLAQYRQTYINEVDLQQNALNGAADSFRAADAKNYLENAAKSLGDSVLNLAVEGENLQRQGKTAAEGKKSEKPAEQKPALDFTTLASLKQSVKSELAGQAAEISVWRQIESIGGQFDQSWANYKKTFEKSPALAGLAGNLAARRGQKSALEALKKQYDAIKVTATSRRAWEEDKAFMEQDLAKIDGHLAEGQKILNTQSSLQKQQNALAPLEAKFRASKPLSEDQYQEELRQLSIQDGELAGHLQALDSAEREAIEFRDLIPELNRQYYQPVSDRLNRLHALLEAKRPPAPSDREKEEQSPAESAHQFRLFAARSATTLTAIDKRVATLEKELAAARKNPDQWQNRADYEAWLTRLQSEIDASASIESQADTWRQQSALTGAADDFLVNKCRPVKSRAELLRTRATVDRGGAVEKNEQKILNDKVRSMLVELTKEWAGKKDSEQYLSITDKLAALKAEDQEYKSLFGKQDALAKDLIGFEGKISFLLSKPDDLDKTLVADLQKLLGDCRQWQNLISGDRVLRQSRSSAEKEPDQPYTYTVEHHRRVYIKNGMGGGHWENQVERQEKTATYKFSQYVKFVNIHEPGHAEGPDKPGRGWVWINGWESLPDQVKQAISNRADLIVQEQKDQVETQSGRERREVRQQDLLTEKGREVLGADAKAYFSGVDLLGRGEVAKAMAEFEAYLKLAEGFDAEKRELHATCIEDARKHIETNRDFPEFLDALKLQSEGKLDEAIARFKEFLNKVNGKFGGAIGPDTVGPENPARQQYAEKINLAIEVIKQYNNDKLKMLDELAKDFIYLQTVDTVRRSNVNKINTLDFDNLKEPERTMMLPYIPAGKLSPAERIRQANHEGGLKGGEIDEIKTALDNLRKKIEQGDPPVDFKAEFEAIRAKLKHNTEKFPGGTTWKDPTTGEYVASSPSSRLLAFFNQINSTDPAVREKGFLAIAAEFKDQEVGMRYTQKYLRQAMVSRYRQYSETPEGKEVAEEVRKRLAADPATNREITTNALELYKRWAAEKSPPLPADPPNQIVLQSFKKNIADIIFEDQYEREMRRKMTERGTAAIDAAIRAFFYSPGRGSKMWDHLTREEKLSWLAGVEDGDLGGALLEGGALKEFNWSRPYDEANAKWYKPWSWSDYNEDDYNDFKSKAADFAIQTVATLPIGWGAGAISRAVSLGAVKLLVCEGLSEAAVSALSRGGFSTLFMIEKAGEKAIWSTLSSGMRARLLLHYGMGIAAEGAYLALMNSVWEGMYNGRSELFDALDTTKYGKAGLVLLENIAKAGLFRGVGMAQRGISGLAGPNSRLLSRVLAEVGGETVSGVGGAGVEALFMLNDPKLRNELGWEWFAKSVLQNAAGSVAMRAGHSGMEIPQMGFMKGSREGTARRLTEAEMRVTRERLSERGIRSPADIQDVRIEANGDLFLRLRAGGSQTIRYSEIPFGHLPQELQRHLYLKDKSNRDALEFTLLETGLDSPHNWTAVTADGAVISATGHIVPIPDPALLPPALREKHRRLIEEYKKNSQSPYRVLGEVAADRPAVPAAKPAPATGPGSAAESGPATKPGPAAESAAAAPAAPRPAPELPARQLPDGEAGRLFRQTESELAKFMERYRLAEDPVANAKAIAKLDAEIAAAAKERNLSVKEYRQRLLIEVQIYRGLDSLDHSENRLYGESKIIKKPVLDENGVQKKDANDQPLYEEINLFANYQSKSAAYSREMLRSLSYERLVAEGGGKIIKLGGDELVVYHAGPDGMVQKLFIDISNMGPTNDTATNIAGSRINLVDIYLHRLSDAVLAQSKAHQGKLLDPTAFNAEVQRVADSLFNLDRDAGGQPLPEAVARENFRRLQTEWNLEGTFEQYLVDMRSMRILAEYRSDTRGLDSSYKKHPERTFSEHIATEIEAISGLSVTELQKLIAAHRQEFRTAFDGRLPKSPKLKAMPVDQLLESIGRLDPATSKPEDLMALYSLLARMDTSALENLPAVKPLTDRLAATRSALVGDPPHPRVEQPRMMDAKVVSINLPPDIAKALAALAETDPVRAHAILATARQFSEKALDALKYGERGRFAEFKITDHLELKDGQLQFRAEATEFQQAVATAQADKKISNVIDAEDNLRTARSKMEGLRQQLQAGKIDRAEFLAQTRLVEREIAVLQDRMSIDPDTGAYGQAYLDVKPSTIFHFPGGLIHPNNRVWHSVITELGHSGAINAKYGYQAMDQMMAEYCAILRQGIAAELPPLLQHFKIIRSGGGKFEVVFLNSRAVDYLAQKGLTPQQLIERLANGPGQQVVNRLLQSDPAKLAATQSDAAVRNSQFRYNKGTEAISVGQLSTHTETILGRDIIQQTLRANPEFSARSLLAVCREQAARAAGQGETLPLPGEVSAMVDPNAYSFQVRKNLSDIQALEASRQREKPYDPANDPEFLLLTTDRDRENYLARKSEEIQNAILKERLTPDTHARIAQMADLLIEATIMHNKEKYVVDRRLTGAGELPSDWQQHLVNRGPAQFIEGRSHILVLKNAKGEGPDNYLIVNAETVYRGDLNYLMPIVSMSRHKAYQEISTGLQTEMKQISKSIKTTLSAAQEARIKETSSRFAATREAVDTQLKQMAESARRRPLLDNSYTRSLLEYGRKVRNDPEIKKLPPGERRAAIGEKIRAESERIRAEILARQKAVAEISDLLFTSRRENPQLPIAELQALFRRQAESRRLQLNPAEQKQIDARIAAIAQKQELVSQYYQKYSGNPEELFALTFGFRPTGKVELVKSDFSVNFRLHSLEDVGKIYTDITNESFSAGTMGFNIPTSRLQDLAGLINVIRGDSSQVYDQAAVIRHEERQALNRTLLPDNMLNGIIILALGRANSLQMVRELYRQHLQISLKRAQDEISAYQEQGINQNSIRRVLTEAGGGYDYWKALGEKTRNSIIENIAGKKQPAETEGEYAARRQKVSEEVDALFNEYRDLHNRRVVDMVSGAFENPHPVLNVTQTAAELGLAGRRARRPSTEQPPRDKDVPLLGEEASVRDDDIPLVDDDVPLEEAPSPPADPREALLQDISYEEAVKQRREIGQKRNQANQEGNKAESRRLEREYNIATIREELAEAIRDQLPAEQIGMLRRELRDHVSRHLQESAPGRTVEAPKSQISLPPDVNIAPGFLDQMGYRGSITAESGGMLDTQTGGRASVEKSGEAYILSESLHFNNTKPVSSRISEFTVYAALPPQASGRQVVELLQLAKTFFQQNPALLGDADFRMILPSAGGEQVLQPSFVLTNQNTAREFAAFLDTQLSSRGYPPLNDASLGRIGTGRVMIGADMYTIGGEKITHQERVQKARQEAEGCGGDAACRSRVYKKWKINPEDNQPLFGPESHDARRPQYAELLPPSSEETLPAGMPYQDHLLGDYEGPLNLVPRVSENTQGADPKYLNIMGGAVERLAGRLSNIGIPSLSEAMDFLAFERSRVGGASRGAGEQAGRRRKSWLYSNLSEGYPTWEGEARSLLETKGVEVDAIQDPWLKMNIETNVPKLYITKAYAVVETIPGTGERVVLTTIGQEINGQLYWLHPTQEHMTKVMKYVDVLFQRTQKPDISQSELIATVAEIQWWISHAAPYDRGSAAISDALSKSLLLQHGIRPGRWKVGIMPDIKAFHTPREQYIREYASYFEGGTTPPPREVAPAPQEQPALAPSAPREFPASPGLAYSGNKLSDFPSNMTGHTIRLPGSQYDGWVIMKDLRQVNGTLEILRWNEGTQRFEGKPFRVEPGALDFAHFHDFQSGLETIPSFDVLSRFDRIGNNLERVLRYIDDFNRKSRVEAGSRDGKIYAGEDWEVYIKHDGRLQFFMLTGREPLRSGGKVSTVEGRPVTEYAAGIPDAMIDRLLAGEHLDPDTGLDRPVRLRQPIEKARAERLDAEVEQFFQSELQGRSSENGQMIYFNKEHADGRLERNRDLRKAYLSPPYDQMVPFVRELMRIINERNLGMQGAKFFKPAIERDGGGNIVGQNYAGLCFYFGNDADFGQFIAAVREARERTGTKLLSFSDQQAPGTGKIEGGQILFGVDNPLPGGGGFTHGSLSRELEAAALTARDQARKEGKSPQETRLAMRQSLEMVVRQHRGIGLDRILDLNSPHGLSENQLRLIRERHPRDFQEALPLYERIPEMGRVLEQMGLHESAAQLMDLNTAFSQVDGFIIDTPVKRLAYFSYLNNIVANDPLLRQWYLTRPRVFQPQDLAAAANFKEFNRKFVQEQVIPFLAGKSWSILEKCKILHEWLARGSLAQREVLADPAESYSISGQYREVPVRIGPYRAPAPQHVGELMGLYDAHIQVLGRQLEQMKGKIPAPEFERNVLKLAAYTMQNFSRIHPMRDGNGRTARALYDYIVFKYLGADSPYRQLPLEADNNPGSLGSLRGDLTDALYADRDGLFAEAQDPNRRPTPAEANDLRNHNATALKERFLDNQWEKLARDPDIEAFVTHLMQPTETPQDAATPTALETGGFRSGQAGQATPHQPR